MKLFELFAKKKKEMKLFELLSKFPSSTNFDKLIKGTSKEALYFMFTMKPSEYLSKFLCSTNFKQIQQKV